MKQQIKIATELGSELIDVEHIMDCSAYPTGEEEPGVEVVIRLSTGVDRTWHTTAAAAAKLTDYLASPVSFELLPPDLASQEPRRPANSTASRSAS